MLCPVWLYDDDDLPNLQCVKPPSRWQSTIQKPLDAPAMQGQDVYVTLSSASPAPDPRIREPMAVRTLTMKLIADRSQCCEGRNQIFNGQVIDDEIDLIWCLK